MYSKDNIFYKIIHNQIPTEKIYEDEFIIAINDIAPVAPIHILVIPKGEFVSFDDFTQQSTSENIAHFFKTVQHIAQKFNLSKDGYRLIANHGKQSNQTVPHFHMHIIGGKQLGRLLGK